MKKLILIALVCSALYSSAQGYFGVKPIVNEPSCYGSTNGSIQLSLVGGTGPYQYNWSGGLPGTITQSNIGAGTYSVTVTDANSLTTTYTIIIGQPYQIQINETQNAPQSHGASNGSIATTVDGGTPGYAYLWSNGSTAEDLSELPAGTYTLTVTDEAGCTATGSYTLTQPNAPHFQGSAQIMGDPRSDVASNSNSSDYANTVTAKADLKSEDVQAYPIPASNVVTLKTGNVTATEITVYDLNGQVVSQQKGESNETNINVSELPKGNYLVEIKTASGTIVNKTITVVK